MNQDLFFNAANARALGRKRVPQIWSVSQVNALARELLEGSVPLLRVAGEVTAFKRYRAGHCFFTLKDDRSRLSCVMWREAAARLPTRPPEGLAVHVLGHPSVFVRAGRLQFVVRELEAQGDGLWRLAFDRIRAKLEAEGLLDEARKRRLPRFPVCVGLVTSREGAVLRDVVSVIRRRAPWIHIAVYATRVQGDGAAGSIAKAITAASRTGLADILIVGRGGGSREDLWAFNDERVARALAGARIPIISAVGHETDVTIADLVADRRAATPSAAAELAVPEAEQLRAFLAGAGERMASAVRRRTVGVRDRLSHTENRLVDGVRAFLESRARRVEVLRQRLEALGPLAVLKRGYGLALDPEGKILRRVGDFADLEEFTLRVRDGLVRARVQEVEELE